jgi:hypothetical protein
VSNQPLKRLITAARKAERRTAELDAKVNAEAPYGFAARVAALWSRGQPDRIVVWERLAWRGLICALLVCVATAVAQKSLAHEEFTSEIDAPQQAVEDDSELF